MHHFLTTPTLTHSLRHTHTIFFTHNSKPTIFFHIYRCVPLAVIKFNVVWVWWLYVAESRRMLLMMMLIIKPPSPSTLTLPHICVTKYQMKDHLNEKKWKKYKTTSNVFRISYCNPQNMSVCSFFFLLPQLFFSFLISQSTTTPYYFGPLTLRASKANNKNQQ